MVYGIIKIPPGLPAGTFRGWGIYSSSTLEVAVRVGVSVFCGENWKWMELPSGKNM